MSEEREHTPTPEYWLSEYSGGTYFTICGKDYPDEFVARFPRRSEAEKFLGAVNSHEALLEAAKGYLWSGHEPTDSDVHQENQCRQCRLEKAIAQAEGKEGE